MKAGQLTGFGQSATVGELTSMGQSVSIGCMAVGHSADARRVASIGHIGKQIVFETSDERILNFTQMQRTVKGRWASHPRVGKKPRKQFLGPDADEITFTITLNAEHGVRPRKTVETIEKLIRTGKPQTVVIGSSKVGSGKYAITEMSEGWDTILNRGEVVKITCNITLEEYS